MFLVFLSFSRKQFIQTLSVAKMGDRDRTESSSSVSTSEIIKRFERRTKVKVPRKMSNSEVKNTLDRYEHEMKQPPPPPPTHGVDSAYAPEIPPRFDSGANLMVQLRSPLEIDPRGGTPTVGGHLPLDFPQKSHFPLWESRGTKY